MTEMRKTQGLMGLERTVRYAAQYASKNEYPADKMLDWMVEQIRCDLDNTAAEGMNLLVRVALAARLDHQGGCAPETCGGSSLDPCSLANALAVFENWERSL